ncbi:MULTISPECIES: hypothetical protein [Sorangium]|uniref:Uncharacterized protein n=1 Tax=Sorangium cellulosum TaxID=56 RepID=A0A4P2R4Z9_SORCE|nr:MULTISPECIES: hypothetical protein [Sorangium]AUX38169.1 hypothetical protein SOCE836_104090 [Sorangium cellulosum]WCQ97457.1 hypothetical protein NQZ70_10251 [Sorangium sp. Soce836]
MRNILITVFVFIAGCGDDAQVAGKVACDFNGTASGVTVHSCGEIDDDGTGEQESQCKSSGDVEAKLVDSCSTDDVLGTCILTRDGGTMTLYYYESEMVTEDVVKPICEGVNGTWTAS